MPQYTIMEYSPLLDSSCMTPEHWVQIASDVEANYLLFDGFVIIMGTDTMAYASSALSFMLENLAKPVIFTGSQIPIAEVYSDARRNLIVSAIFAASSSFNEVCIFFGENLLRANRSIKLDSLGLHAFSSPNMPALATLGVHLEEARELMLPVPRVPLKGRILVFSSVRLTIHTHQMYKFAVHKRIDAKVLVLRLTPNFDYSILNIIVREAMNLKGIVLEMYGTGSGLVTPVFLDSIREARRRGIVVVAVTQCLHGGVSLDTVRLSVP
jgi:L-asparaginase